jgi:hypothetical protein
MKHLPGIYLEDPNGVLSHLARKLVLHHKMPKRNYKSIRWPGRHIHEQVFNNIVNPFHVFSTATAQILKDSRINKAWIDQTKSTAAHNLEMQLWKNKWHPDYFYQGYEK